MRAVTEAHDKNSGEPEVARPNGAPTHPPPTHTHKHARFNADPSSGQRFRLPIADVQKSQLHCFPQSPRPAGPARAHNFIICPLETVTVLIASTVVDLFNDERKNPRKTTDSIFYECTVTRSPPEFVAGLAANYNIRARAITGSAQHCRCSAPSLSELDEAAARLLTYWIFARPTGAASNRDRPPANRRPTGASAGRR